MIAISLSWIIILYTLFSCGDILIALYSNFCKQKVSYNVLDTLLLGLSFVLILLPLSSFWLPSDHYILLVYVCVTTMYWIFNRKRLKGYLKHIAHTIKALSLFQRILLIMSILSVLIFILNVFTYFDGEYYHFQNIRWNEEYPVIPGLASIEDRFGFNSNYLLLSALFSLRFIFGEPVYGLQSLLMVLMLCWVLINIFRSQYNIRYIVLLLFLFAVLFIDGYMLSSSNTDIIPLLCSFYYIARTGLRPAWIKEQPLLACLLPVTLVTFKLSSAILCLICLIVLVSLIKEKRFRPVVFILVLASLIIVFWCIRNVIITGYLVYPLYSIDLFSFDWEMPYGTVMLQKEHIYQWAKIVYDIFYIEKMVVGIQTRTIYWYFLIHTSNFILYILALISPVVIILCKLVKKKKPIDRILLSVFAVSILSIVFGVISAPDLRFFNSYIYGCIFLSACILLSFWNKDKLSRKNGMVITTAVVICFVGWVGHSTKGMIDSDNFKRTPQNMQSLLIRPWHPPYTNEYTEYRMGDITIYLTNEGNPRTLDKLPATNEGGIPFEPFIGGKAQSIKTVEMRGKSIRDGFRTKKEYIEIINTNAEKYRQEYIEVQKERYKEEIKYNNMMHGLE